MRVVVTGAGGFVGAAVAHVLLARGDEVVGLARDPGRLPTGVRPVTGSVLDPDVVATALRGADAVCHLAARVRVRESWTDPLGFWRTNLDGTRTVLAAAGPDVPVVMTSTCAVYAPADDPVREDAPLAPAHPYAASKLAADLLARDVALAGGAGVVCLRAANVAGAVAGRGDGDRTRLVPGLLATVLGERERFTVHGDGSAVRDLVHVADLAEGVVAALGVAGPGTWRAYTLGSGRPTSVAELVEVVGAVTGRPVPVHHDDPVEEPPRLVADPTRARAELGWTASRSTPERIVADAWAAVGR
ncbi:NAD-dependent epimerase/dehydratase family protein [Actinomycetospora sp. TBRC 11914]|uniref:NAD-dependent epimerase/dehydratase family protein n=1 Tax=Actinomycetospora sp. TBRC 11914 TaxID=2729387 RepID=UPI00145E5791|nr:NAD-dependent epimerase/dehydratase family protein [Actinomycetospora sp. TBRC 11914]NMO88161.1 UDP-glucose 4-epimerase [Actinomycetospora sp. TBRC 11914]